MVSVRRVRSPRAHGGWALIDVIVGGVILAIGLATVVSLAERALALQQKAEREAVAATLVDGLLADVLATGVVEWESTRSNEGAFDPPFDDWAWQVDIDQQGLGDPYSVAATVTDPNGSSYRVSTLIAPRPDGVTLPERAPQTPLDRQARYDADE
jgi:type II secretory pathway pseudopilin PulG